MSKSGKTRERLQSMRNIPQQVMNYISEAVSRIFSPRDDDYPATGVQPFEGDPADKRND
ncbi:MULTISPECIES: hypothetical protein [Cyanophyceae]|uniref:hypothetical protein n=1 Tax=Cyanophyceae TaxID=3028117 RepID=UPI000B2962E7|nr:MULTISPECIES: hypothetical protein [Cyanophyceae]MDB9357551.1 hypothetical protein [Nodularia spumigena CS-587/03]MDB9306131.1 hypothetical protein [Nodularia spumigena CS-591/12]MDB9319816.1 hypothetical protein [Nodularia spumigena CS-590/01A]MDB9322053.1 hypothetical protein [Nodularia spumigena CS-591/07A]MDB9327655.1 hypothetical protein [Nodularia spumigena CS-590/02]